MTISQVSDALQVILERQVEGLMTRCQIRDLACRLADQILVTQERNRRARNSACQRRQRDLTEAGINWEHLPVCKVHDGSL